MLACTSGWSAQAPILKDVAYALGDWGGGDDPNLIASRSTSYYTTAKTTYGLKAFMPVGLQQVRAASGKADESMGLEAMMDWWERYTGSFDGTSSAIENPEFLQLITWSDYSEGSTYQPSLMWGRAPLDISTYYIHKYKTGAWPTILRDTAYVVYRPAPIGVTSTYGEADQMVQWSGSGRPTSGLSTPGNWVHAVVFLVSAATVRIWTAGVYTDFSGVAGMNVFRRSALVGSAPKVEIIRAGTTITSVTGPRPILSAPYVRDYSYIGAGSLDDPTELTARSHTPSLR